MHLISKVAFAVFVFLVGSSHRGNAETLIHWDGLEISLSDLKDVDPGNIRGQKAEKKLRSKKVINCEYLRKRTKCYIIGPNTGVYGENMSFVSSIAVIPESIENIDDQREKPDPDLDDNGKYRVFDQSYVDTLMEFSPRLEVYSKKARAVIVDYYSDMLASDTYDVGFSAVSTTVNGDAALAFWRSMVGQMPKRECRETNNYCAVILSATQNGRPALVYCGVANTKIGIGLPFNCRFVAFQGKQSWYVLSYLGPSWCDGCGASSGAYCTLQSNVKLNDAAKIFAVVVKSSKMNLSLSMENVRGEVRLTGKNTAINSQFFDGYFDRSFAVYNMSARNRDDGKREIVIEGLFNLLISAEPSQEAKYYRDIDANADDVLGNLGWLQEEVSKIFEDKFSKKMRTNVECSVEPIG